MEHTKMAKRLHCYGTMEQRESLVTLIFFFYIMRFPNLYKTQLLVHTFHGYFTTKLHVTYSHAGVAHTAISQLHRFISSIKFCRNFNYYQTYTDFFHLTFHEHCWSRSIHINSNIILFHISQKPKIRFILLIIDLKLKM